MSRQLRERYTEESHFVRCLDESLALTTEREWKEGGSQAVAELAVRGTQAILRAARRLLYLQNRIIGARHALRERKEVGVEKKAFVVHLWTLWQMLFILLSVWEFGVRRWDT